MSDIWARRQPPVWRHRLLRYFIAIVGRQAKDPLHLKRQTQSTGKQTAAKRHRTSTLSFLTKIERAIVRDGFDDGS